jgi:ribosome-associated heat shock protein Hsp15
VTGQREGPSSGDAAAEPLRVDKWLWCARFFRTRSLAAAAVAGGKVHVNGSRVKPSRPVHPGDTLEITLGADAVTVTVRSLPARRGPATEARQSYEETVDSVARRERHREQRRLAAMAAPQTPGRPDKRTRRELLRFHRNQDGS